MNTAHPIRPWEPDQLVRANDGSRSARLSPKRICNGCQLLLGDTTGQEMLDVARGFDLRDVGRECPRCNGLHTLLLIPEARPIGWHPDDGDTIAEQRVICPRREDTDRDCFVWDRCRCQAPADFDPLSSEGQAWLGQPCPSSPTREHAWLEDHELVACPQPGSCWHADAADITDLADAAGVGSTPGVYALDTRLVEDESGFTWAVVDVAAWRRRQATVPVPTG